jgi:hypothetical protein
MLLGHIDELSREKERGIRSGLHLLFKMANTKHFCRHLVYLLKQMVANFIRANKDIEIEGQLISGLIAQTGLTVDGYIAQHIFARHVRPNALCLRILPVVLRISLKLLGGTEFTGRPNGNRTYSAILPNCKIDYNDSLQLHNEVLHFYIDEYYSVKCLYIFTNEEGLFNYRNLTHFGAVESRLTG